MKILWITNIIFPAAAEGLGLSVPVVGGWMYSLASSLSKHPEVELAVATIFEGKVLKSIYVQQINYFLLPSTNMLRYQPHLEDYWNEVCNSFKPDLIHIQGTEYPHGLACMNKRSDLNYIISIQGILSLVEKYYLAGISRADIYKNITPRDLLRMDTLIHAKKKVKKRSSLEREYFRQTKHVIGRTTWDKVHAQILGPGNSYHFCNESLRAKFYTSSKWSINNCRKHSIFLSQALYPLKGLHQVLKAVALLKADFPDIIIKVAGPDITRSDGWKNRLRISGYGLYILRLIRRFGLKKHIEFMGQLDEYKMIEAYLDAHVFICPSSIENSPNSLGESQILGLPSIGSYVGGIPDMINHEQTGLLYRFEEVEMLSHNIRRIFECNKLAMEISKNEISVAEKRHDLNHNVLQTIEIYKNVIKSHR